MTNVNANALILTKGLSRKSCRPGQCFQTLWHKGLSYYSPRFSAPVEIGKLKTADPLDPEVIAWWTKKVEEIYSYIPDFGGFLIKANSEGQPGPQNYKRSHADGANMFADAACPS